MIIEEDVHLDDTTEESDEYLIMSFTSDGDLIPNGVKYDKWDTLNERLMGIGLLKKDHIGENYRGKRLRRRDR